MENIIAVCVIWVFALAAALLSVLAFRHKGPLLNNAWLFASKKERESMDTAPYYRQSGVVFALIAMVFLLNGSAALLEAVWLSYAATGVIVITAVYAVVSAAAIEKRKKGNAV